MYILRTITALAILAIGTQCVHLQSHGRRFSSRGRGRQLIQNQIEAFSGVSLTQSQDFNQVGVPLTQSQDFNQVGVPLTQSQNINYDEVPLTQSQNINYDGVPLTQDQSIDYDGVPLELQAGGSSVNEVVEQDPIDTPVEEDPLAKLAVNIPGGGVPGVDYPILGSVPDSGFECLFGLPGYFADPADESRCQAFHICLTDGTKYDFICPNGTLFNQQFFICDWWYNVDCSASKDFQDLLLSLDLELGKIDESVIGIVKPFDDKVGLDIDVQPKEPLITASNNNPVANLPIGHSQYYTNNPSNYVALYETPGIVG